jgi:superfamily II DNA or RNA helicase
MKFQHSYKMLLFNKMKRKTPEYTIYEYQVMDEHRQTTSHKTWHWNHIPEQELYNAGYITDFNKYRLAKRLKKNNGQIGEFGLDGLAVDLTSNTYHGIQAKFYTGTITADKLGTFLSVIHNRLKIKDHQSNGYLYHTGKLQIDLKEDFQNGNAILPIHFVPTSNTSETTQLILETNFKLYDPQVDALNSLLQGWAHTGFVSLPCGVGKTVILGHFLKQCFYKNIIIVSPLRILAKQTLERLKAFLPTHTPLLVDVDGDLDNDHMKEGFSKTTLMSTTFKSFANLFSQLDMSETFVVMDESHHLRNTMLDVQYEHNEKEQYNIQKTLEASKKVLLLTGTPTTFMEQNYEEIYYYTLSDAIQDGHICDYKICLPEVCDANTNLPIELENVNQPSRFLLQALFLVNGMLLHGCKRCIAYLPTIEECGLFNIAFEEVCDKYHGIEVFKEEITAHTTQKRRDEILEKFEKDVSKDLYVIASVRVLDEGVNLVKCDSIFMNTVPNDITFVQRLCRANRKDSWNANKIASCFLWENEYENAIHLFKYLTKCDPNFSKKIEISRRDYDNTSLESTSHLEQVNSDFLHNISIRILTHTQKWESNLEAVKAYIDKEKKRPSSASTDETTKKLGSWIGSQQANYSKRERIMNEESIRKKWEEFVEEYKVHFFSNEEEWEMNLEAVKAYIDKEKKRPSPHSIDETTKKLGKWIGTQQTNYSKRKDIMKEESIRKKWEEFVEEYNVYFLSNEEEWEINLEAVKAYIDKEKKRPSTLSKDETTKKMGSWINVQQRNYSKRDQIMKEESIRNKWEEFMKEYKVYHVSNEEEWEMKLEEVKAYIDKEKKRPSCMSKDETTKKLAKWIGHQQYNYSKRDQIMKEESIRKKWEECVEVYKVYFLSKEEEWEMILEKVKAYIDKEKKRPSSTSKDETTKKLGNWTGNQKMNYSKREQIMKEESIRKKWEEFVDEYKVYFLSNEIS